MFRYVGYRSSVLTRVVNSVCLSVCLSVKTRQGWVSSWTNPRPCHVGWPQDKAAHMHATDCTKFRLYYRLLNRRILLLVGTPTKRVILNHKEVYTARSGQPIDNDDNILRGHQQHSVVVW